MFDARTDVQGLAPSTPLKTTIHCRHTPQHQPTDKKNTTTPVAKEIRRKVKWVSGGKSRMAEKVREEECPEMGR